MSGHDFEKKVQQAMDELRLHPSDAVWTNVNRSIRNKQRRRTIFLWLTVSLLMLSGGGYFIFNSITADQKISATRSKGNSSQTVQQDNKVPAANSSEDVTVKKRESNSLAKTTVEEKKDADKADIGKNKTRSGQSLLIENKPKKTSITKINHSPKTSPAVAVQKKKKTGILHRGNINNPVIASPDTGDDEEVVTKPSEPNISLEKEVGVINTEWQITDMTNSIADFLNDRLKNEFEKAYNNKLVVEDKKRNNNSTKWQWGVNASTGIAKISEGSFFNVFESSLVASDKDYSGAVATPGNPNPPPQTVYSSVIKTGLNWTVGAFVERQVSRRISIGTGLRYSYSDTRVTIGSRVDSLATISNSANYALQVNAFYRGGASTNYTNHYHFIELPVTMQLKLNRSNKIPFNWNAGFTVAQLLHTNALHFDKNTGVYYKDSDLFKRTQLGLTTGFSIRLFNTGKHPLDLGPAVQYNISNLFASTASGRQHVFTAGVDARWLIKK